MGFPKLLRSEKGNAAIEFALLAPLLFLLFFGIVELGLIQFSNAVIESAGYQVARKATIGDSGGQGTREAYIRQQLSEKTFGLIEAGKVIITTNVDRSPRELNPERCTGNAGYCPCPDGVAFFDTNRNGLCDQGGGANLSPGNAGELIRYQIVYPWEVVTPLLANILGGEEGVVYLRTLALVKNEPFGNGG